MEDEEDLADARRILKETKTGKQKLLPLLEFEKMAKESEPKTKKGKS